MLKDTDYFRVGSRGSLKKVAAVALAGVVAGAGMLAYISQPGAQSMSKTSNLSTVQRTPYPKESQSLAANKAPVKLGPARVTTIP